VERELKKPADYTILFSRIEIILMELVSYIY